MKKNPLEELEIIDQKIAKWVDRRKAVIQKTQKAERKQTVRRWIILGRVLDEYRSKTPEHEKWARKIIENARLSESEKKFLGLANPGAPIAAEVSHVGLKSSNSPV